MNNKINFTSGKAVQYGEDHFELALYNDQQDVVYSATLDLDAFIKVTSKHKNIEIVMLY